MRNWVIKYFTLIYLMGLVIFDSIASFILWSYYGMVENNPIMLSALKMGWIYWLFTLTKIMMVIIIGYEYYNKNKIARIGVWLLIIVYTCVWLQYFVGELV